MQGSTSPMIRALRHDTPDETEGPNLLGRTLSAAGGQALPRPRLREQRASPRAASSMPMLPAQQAGSADATTDWFLMTAPKWSAAGDGFGWDASDEELHHPELKRPANSSGALDDDAADDPLVGGMPLVADRHQHGPVLLSSEH
jgi:hypothetical protein